MAEQVYDRVTEVLSPFSGVEFVPQDILDAAAKKGTKVHSYIEGTLKGEAYYIPDYNHSKYVQSFLKFWDKSKHAFEGGEIILEKRLFCEEKKISGAMDVIVKMPDRTYIIDWKTSSRPQKSWQLQGAAYKYLCKVNGFESVDNVLFVHLSKDANQPSLQKSENYEENLDIFDKCLELYRWFDMKNTRNTWRKS